MSENEILKDTEDTIKDKAEDIFEAVKDKAEDIIDAADDKATEMQEAVEDKVDDIKEAVKDKIEDVKDAMEDKAEDVKDAVEDKAEDVKDAVEEKVEDVKDVVEDKVEDVKEAVEDKVEDVKDAVEDKVEDAKDAVEDKAEDVKEAAKDKKDKKKDKEENDTRSNSQKKREQRRKEVAKARRQAKTASVIGYVCLAVVAALIIWGVAALVMRQLDKVTPNENYSDGLDANGYISGVVASDKITLPDYKGIEVPYSEIEFADADIDAEIEDLLSGYDSLNTDESRTVEDGDDVEIAYEGKIDGVAFDGGTSDSFKLTIGSHSFIDDFEEQLIGANVGSTVEVNVTFPEDYQTADLAGKDAVFTVDVNGIYDTATFDDAFVEENLSDKATTAEGYREYVRNKHEDESLETYLKDYLVENTTVNSYPSKYVKTLKGIKMYDDQQSYEYMNQFYQSYYGSGAYDSFESYVGTSMAEYYKTLKDQAKDTCKENLIWQAIVEKEGAVADAAYYKAKLVEDGESEDYYDTQVTTSGEPFVLQQAIAAKAMEIVKDAAVIQK